MHYLLGRQQFYFPSSDDQSYTLQEFLDNKCNNEYQLPIIVKITSLNIPGRSIKNLLSKNTPLLLLDTYQFESILAEYHRSNDGRFHSNRRRLTLAQGKLSSKTTTKSRINKKLSKSLVTLTTTANPIDDNSDEDYDNTRTIIRILNEKNPLSNPFCRVPINYHGFFELLNENDQAIEPFHKLSDLLIIECKDENNQQIRTEKWPQAFFLRSTCTAYTKRYIPEERKLSGSADSCYGSLSDIDSHKNLLILNDDRQILQPGQIITILNQCSAYNTQLPVNDFNTEQFISHSSTSWLRNKSRLFFPKRKIPTSYSHNNNNNNKQFIKKNIYDISKKSQPYLKCQTEQGDIIYIPINESGLFSPLNSQNSRLNSTKDSEQLDISGVFQLKELVTNFRFPISVRLLNNSISFDNIYSPASINQYESSFYSSTKFRLLFPYTENVIFACPLIISSSFKSQIIVIPIPTNSEIEIQRCLNMREILKNQYFHNLIQTCYHIINQYKTEFSYIHFPLVLNTITKRKQPLFKKRSQSESHIEYYSLDLTKDNYRKSCEILNNDNDQSNIIVSKHEQLYHHDSFEKIKQKLSNHFLDNNQRQQTIRRSNYYDKLKRDKLRKSSRHQQYDSEDENYRELDHIYDYIRSGDITDDVQRIQAKEQALNREHNQRNNISKVCVSAVLDVPNSIIKQTERRISLINDNPETMKIHRFPHNLDDSRPLDTESDDDDDDDDDIPDTQYDESRRNTDYILSESINSKPITKMKRISKK
jgi:hypothetical protein